MRCGPERFTLAVRVHEIIAPTMSFMRSHAEFKPGQIVCLKSEPSTKGAVVEVLPGNPENRVKVFLNGNVQTYYASQLRVDDHTGEDTRRLSVEQFHAYLSALQIRHPDLSKLYSLNAARVDFIPYQFRPVLKFIRSDRPRLLIADSVGVGKTIEAGLILRELQARRDMDSVLIVCPRALVTERKWELEMKRFDERFTHLDGRTLKYCIRETDLEGVWPDQHKRAILPYSLFDEALLHGTGRKGSRKSRKGLLDLDPPPRFDLVIVDEAHHIRNTDTYSHQAVRFFCDHAEAAVFLTATPVQLGSHDLFVLLNVLRPDLFPDQESFEHVAEPNPHINRAVDIARTRGTDWAVMASGALEEAGQTAWGQAILVHNPEFQRIRGLLANGGMTEDERVQLITDLEGLHTLSGVINRTRRRDIGEFTIRKPRTVNVEFTEEQKRFHDDLLRIQAEIFIRLHGDANILFMMSTIRRQAASCLYGLVPFLKEILNRHAGDLAWEDTDDFYDAESVQQSDAIDPIRAQIQNLLERARSLDPHDPKVKALYKIIRDKQNQPNNKIMLFSSFRHTLGYLYGRLRADGVRVGMMHGGTPDEERVELRRRFETPREDGTSLDVLLFSEIGSEGLDYQFCDFIVNYDLPWNPMRVEQRIGRIDRMGQKSESVAIVNMITPGTIDADIYERCLLRIGVFEKALGGGEEILGEITKEIRDIAENYTLSEEDRRDRLKQLADNKIRLIQEQETLEQEQMELVGIRVPEERMRREVEEASSFWLTPASVYRLVTHYLRNKCGRGQEYILGEKPLKTLRLSQEARNLLLEDFRLLPRQNALIHREWEKWLKDGNPHLPVTFEADCAAEHRDAAFIMPLHPLVKQAAMSFDNSERVFTSLSVRTHEVPPGRYEFVIYLWQFHGIRDDLALKPIASSEILTSRLDGLLEAAVEVDTVNNEPERADSSVWEQLDAQHYHQWSEARGMHEKRTRAWVAYRRESLTTSHRARIAQLTEQLAGATDEKLQRMRRSQIDSANADFERRMHGLDVAMDRMDIVAEPVGYGILHVNGLKWTLKNYITDDLDWSTHSEKTTSVLTAYWLICTRITRISFSSYYKTLKMLRQQRFVLS